MTTRALYIPRSTAGQRIRRATVASYRTLRAVVARTLHEMDFGDWAFTLAALFACGGACWHWAVTA